MSIILSILSAIWPFFKEMVLGNKGIGDFLLEHKWVFINLIATMVLFLLFINQYMVNIQTQMNNVGGDQKIRIEIVELQSLNERQADQIKVKDDKILELESDYELLVASCKPDTRYPKQRQSQHQKPTVKPLPPTPVVVEDIVDKENIERLEKLRINSKRTNGG